MSLIPEIETGKSIVEKPSAARQAKLPVKKDGLISRRTKIISEDLQMLTGSENGESKIQGIGNAQKGQLRYKIP